MSKNSSKSGSSMFASGPLEATAVGRASQKAGAEELGVDEHLEVGCNAGGDSAFAYWYD